MIQFAAKTHPGRRRKSNEDALLADHTHGLFVVADGVGGRAAGEVASALTIETFQQAGPRLAEAVRTYAQSPDWDSRNSVLELLDAVCQQASARVYEEAEHSSRRGMTTTLVVALVGGGAAFLAHVGDSRAYLVRDGLIRQLTEDHSMVNDLVRSGQMTWEEARSSRYRSVITRAVGLYPNVQADLMSIEILPGDRILISSDGLSDPVPADKIEEISCQNDVQTAALDLVDAALDGGGPDNVTVVLVEPEATPETEAARARAQVMQELFLFHGLPFHARLRVSRICRDLKFGPGQALVNEGDLGDAMYVIAQGAVSVTHNGMELAQLGSGEHFGELGLLEDQTRSATVKGTTFGSALVIDRSDLRDFCSREPALGNALLWRLLHTLGHRLRVANDLATGA
jgi:serine/threonine protein phosphatase PrpC